jgi:hypothetical protein
VNSFSCEMLLTKIKVDNKGTNEYVCMDIYTFYCGLHREKQTVRKSLISLVNMQAYRCLEMGCDSAVVIATRYGLDCPWIES